MKKNWLIGMALTLAAALSLVLIIAREEIWFSAESPDGKYLVQMTRNSVNEVLPLASQEVNFNLYEDGKAVLKSRRLKGVDFYEHDIPSQYPKTEWVADSILRFRAAYAEEEERSDSLTVSNRTGKTIKYLRVALIDLFLIFDIKPNSTIVLNVPRSRWNSWVEVEGEFEDGTSFIPNSTNFFHHGKIANLRYCISLNDEALQISSPDIEGSSSDGFAIPKSISCS